MKKPQDPGLSVPGIYSKSKVKTNPTNSLSSFCSFSRFAMQSPSFFSSSKGPNQNSPSSNPGEDGPSCDEGAMEISPSPNADADMQTHSSFSSVSTSISIDLASFNPDVEEFLTQGRDGKYIGAHLLWVNNDHLF